MSTNNTKPEEGKEIQMRLLFDYREEHLRGRLPYIPMGLLNEDQAQRNHGQTLKRLNERGGLGPTEALAIHRNMNQYDLHRSGMTDEQAIEELKKLIAQLSPLSTAPQGEEETISFATWYSGMERSKVEAAYKRYKEETTINQAIRG